MPSLPPSNPYIAGTALGGERGFFGREDILREVERALRRSADNAIVLYGQRRIGKTSILLQLQRRLPQPPFVPIYFDLMDKARLPLSQVLYELAVTTANEVALPPSQRVDFADNPEAFHRLFLPKLYQTLGEERRPVFLLDEFDVLDLADERGLPETAAARAFRPCLRQLMMTEPRLAFVFVVGRRMEELSVEFLSTFKAALARPVSMLTSETARLLILQAEREGALRYEETAVERILALTRGHPYLTQLTCQLLFDHAHDLSTNGAPLVTLADVETAAPQVLETGGNAFQWIWDGLPPAERIIFSAIASQAQEGVIFSEDDISAALQEAGIRILVKELKLAPQTLVDWQMLERVDQGYCFFIELLRRWVAEYRPLDRVKDELDHINPLADTLYQAAQGFYQQGNNKQARVQVRQALDINPNHLKAHLLLGTILREAHHLTEAITEFETAYQLDEQEGRFELLRTLLQQGEALEVTGNETSALGIYDRILAIYPHEQKAQAHRTVIWHKRGDQALARGDLAAAIEAYHQAGAKDKLDRVKRRQQKLELEQLTRKVQAYEQQQEWIRAAQLYRHIIELDPDNKQWQQALSQVEDELRLAEQYAAAIGYTGKKDWTKARKTLTLPLTAL